MAKSASEISRLNAKSTFSKADSEIVTSSSVLGKPAKDFPYPAPLTDHGNAKIISVVNQKGGVGKTTTTINLGAAFAELGRRVLLIDFDPQHSLSIGLNVSTREIEGSVYNLLMDESTQVSDFLLKTSVPGMDMIPSHEDLSGAEGGLVNVIAREKILKRVLSTVTDFYDVILIDCQPSLGLLTVNALTASDWVLVPLECEYFALRGVALLDDIIKKVKANTNPDIELLGILPTMFDRKTVHSREVLERISEAFPAKVFDTTIARTVRFPETTVAGEPITSYASSSVGAASYRRLAREIIANGGVR
ncbi:MAG: ParA family protein [Actinobacteria bacterium]|nr:ParA family protein [Actinomycetota bacterium]NCV16937.1 ParA family protein [Actinomycetota bacterium]NDD51603.1 ParA family protein [Actinomycetota bacterium]NDG68928.1 ParA family protein [Actinomycetota bacterium]